MRVLIFGDSISEGFYDEKMGGYVNHLKIHFFKKNKSIDMTNCAISGDTSKNLIKRFNSFFNSYCKKEKTDIEKVIVIFSIGINDSYIKNNKNKISEKEFEKNLLKLISLCKKEKQIKKVLFFTNINIYEKITTPTIWDKKLFYYSKRVENYNSIIKSICKSNKIKYFDLYGLMDKNDLYDGIHPNSKGHKKIFDFLIENKIENFLK